jgi:chitodextrinase
MRIAIAGFLLSLQLALCASLTTPLHASSHILGLGDKGIEVYALQQFLYDRGFLKVEPVGEYGKRTAQAVVAFQRSVGLEPVGYVGSLTRARIIAMGGTLSTSPTTSAPSPTALPDVRAQQLITSDRTKPTTPRNVVTFLNTSARTATISWTPATDNVAVKEYRIYRSDSATPVGTVSGTVFTDTTLLASKQYRYSVVAIDTTGNTSSRGDGKRVKTPRAPKVPKVVTESGDTTPPSTPGSFVIDALTHNQVTLSWAPSGDNSGVKNYRVYRNGTNVGTVAAPTYTDAALAPNTTYRYTVKAVDTAGNISNSSGEFTITTPVAPAITTPADTTPPTVPGNLGLTTGTSYVILTWNAATDASGIAEYRIFKNGATTPLTIVSGTKTTYTDQNLTPGTWQSYTISAKDAAGNTSALSSSVRIQTTAVITTPTTPTTPTPTTTTPTPTTPVVTTPTTPTTPIQPGTVTTNLYTWKPLKIGAGGWLVGLDIAKDGTKVVRADTYGAYLWTGSSWKQLVTSESMPSGYNTAEASFEFGTYEIAIAPSNSSRMYMMYDGRLFKSDNKGTTWNITSFNRVTPADGNDDHRTKGRKIVVNPTDPNHVMVGTPKNGLWRTSDGGNSWVSVTAVPSGKEYVDAYGNAKGFPGYNIAYANGSIVYASSYGNGVYVSNDSGVSWTRTVGGPEGTNHIVAGSNGAVYASDANMYTSGNEKNIWKYSNGIWTKLISGPQQVHSISIDPQNPQRIIVGRDNGNLLQTIDGGVSWNAYNGYTRNSTDIPWLAWVSGGWMSNGDIQFDPSQTNTLVFSEGIGVWKTNPPYDSGSYTWQSMSQGIEQLVSTKIVSIPGSGPVLTSWDRPVWKVTNPDAYATQHGPDNKNDIVHGWAVDYAASSPNYVVAIMNGGWNGAERSSYSTDGGATWQGFVSKPSAVTSNYKIGGAIAVSTPKNIIWAPSNNTNPYYTLDGGVSWKEIILPGVTDGWPWAYYLNNQNVVADRVIPNKFYLYNTGKGLYTSTDGGVNWTLTYSGQIAPWAYYNTKFRAVPGKAGHLFFSAGVSGGIAEDYAQFRHSTDGGATWTTTPNVREVLAFGFGKEATGSSYPSIYIAGWVNKVYGIWRSDDEGSSWVKVGDYPMGSLDNISAVEGDLNTYGKVYVGFGGSGYAYGTMR